MRGVGYLGIVGFVLLVAVNANAESDVVNLDDRNFAQVLQSDLPYMVEFFAPWCGHCKKLAPEWEKAATNLKGILPVGKVDCTVHQNLCQKYEVQGYPTIKMFSDKGKSIVPYNQDREAAAIVRFATNSIKASIFDVKSDDNLQKYLDSRPSLPHVLLFSAKSTATPLYKSLAVQHKERIVFGLTPQSSKSIVENYGITTFPTVAVVTPEGATVLEGAAEGKESLIATMSELAGIVKGMDESDKRQPKKKSSTKATSSWVSFTGSFDDLKEVCQGLCVLAVSSTSMDASTQASLIAKFSQDEKMNFYTIGSGLVPTLRETFSLAEGPAYVVFNAKKLRFVKSEDVSLGATTQLLERVLEGNVKYISL